ncbi:MAG: hypothetical protein HXY35_17330 [Chloroflexi bacterium]|nr:hypothetical protein [Chloroflexota bacterium]
MKKFAWFEIVLVVIVMSVSLYAALSDAQNLSQRWFIRDDAYYYFKVAQNISEGRGSTFDGINPTNGYHPLWMIICIPIFALARFDLVLPLRILLLIMSALSVASGILLHRLLGRVIAPFVGVLAALYWVFDAYVLNVVYQQGLETGIAAFFIVLLLYKLHEFEMTWRKGKVARQKIFTLGLIAALTMFSRLDLAFLAGLAGFWIVFRGHSLRYYLPLDILSITLSVLFAFVARFEMSDYYEYSGVAVTMIAVSILSRLPLAYFLGLHQNLALEKPLKVLSKLTVFTLIGTIIVSGIMLFLAKRNDFDAMPRTILLMDGLFSLLLVGLTRFVHKGLHANSSSPAGRSPIQTLQAQWRGWLNDGLMYYGVVFSLLGLYMLWNKLAIGTSSPVSGQIKRWWGSFPTRVYGGAARDPLSFFGLNYKDGEGAWQPVAGLFGSWADRLLGAGISSVWGYLAILLLCAVLGFFILRAQRQKAVNAVTRLGIIPLFGSVVLQVVSYNTSGYAAEQNWYWTGQLLLILLTLSLLLGMAAKLIPASRYKQMIAWGIAVIAGVSMSLSYWNNVRGTMRYGYWSVDDPFIDIIPVLEANTEPGSLIGFTGGGNVGYFLHDRTIVNMDGLINSYPYFQALKARTAGEYLNDIGLDYVFANPGLLSGQPYNKQFDPYLQGTGIFFGEKELLKYGKGTVE